MFKVYLAKHRPSGNVYVGVTKKELLRRIGQHLALTPYKRGRFQKFLHTTKYADWDWDVLFELESKSMAYRLEAELIKDYASKTVVLNSKHNREGRRTEQLKEHQFKKGQTPWNKGQRGQCSPETIERMRLAKMRKPSITNWTDEQKEQLRLAQRGRKPIMCNETGIIYPSITKAAEAIGGYKQGLRNHLKGVTTNYRGYTFSPVEKEME